MSRKKTLKKILQTIVPLGIASMFLVAGGLLIWASTLEVPSFEAFEARKVLQSTKIYDRTGTVVLYDTNPDIKRRIIPLTGVSPYIRQATIAIEDGDFYTHYGIRPESIIRALFANIETRSINQGGSTITQQVIKNVLLTKEKTLSRKVKEAFLALKLERELTKDQILELYFNETPYGGPVYGVEEASLRYLGKSAKDVTLAEAAYLAALPQAPTYFSPYGNHRAELDARKNLVLSRMLELGFISKEQFDDAKSTEVVFAPPSNSSVKAPHFSFFVQEWLEEKYGKDSLQTSGYKVITTLDWELQKRAEAIVAKYGEENETKFNARNAGMVGIDPKTGQILLMVGSRDYFDTENEGSFNITTAHRQPGSSFKPFVYATALKKGYTPETILFDVKTQFSTACTADGTPIGSATEADCYMPVNYDNAYRGPMTLRDALAQSINVPAIKALYLVGTKSALETARAFGITSLTDPARYGLTLVLGGGEVSPLELTSAYSVFANDGIRNAYTPILRIEEPLGGVADEFTPSPERVIDENVSRQISDILSDNVARAPSYGTQSLLHFPGHDVAVKTGTTNDYKDAWIMGYTPTIALGAWVGNNDNTPMEKRVAGFIVAPMWNAMMQEIFKLLPEERFLKPEPTPKDLKPVLRGIWAGGDSYKIDKTTGKLATEFTPPENIEERVTGDVHDILYWVSRSDPRGPRPANPAADSQFSLWETAVRAWAQASGTATSTGEVPTAFDDVHTPGNAPKISIVSPSALKTYLKSDRITIGFVRDNRANVTEYPIVSAEFYVGGKYIGSTSASPFQLAFIPQEINATAAEYEVKVVVQDSQGNRGQAVTALKIQQTSF